MDGPEERDADTAPEPRPTTFKVLAVCVGNVCRSPAAELLVRLRLGDDRSIAIASAGTRALKGHGVAEPMKELLWARGADPSGFTARQLTASMLDDADLVIPMSRELRSATVTLSPRSLRRTFTLRELAALMTAVDPVAVDAAATGGSAGARLRAIVPLALRFRGLRQRRPEDDDVVDPWLRSPAVYRKSMLQIERAVDLVVTALGAGRA